MFLRRPFLLTAVLAAALLLMGIGVVAVRQVEGGVDVAGSGQISIGVWEPGTPDSLKNLSTFERDEGIHAGLVLWYQSWDNAQDGPDMRPFKAITARGSIPYLTWEPQYYSRSESEPIYRLADIAAGKYDAYVQKWARAFAAFHHPIMLRWGHEMNGNWYPWGTGVNGNTPADYIAAWRHLHDVFIAAGARNVRWVWSPNVADPGGPLEEFYPGDAYVDWVALDGYNRANDQWRSFTQIFQDSYQRLTALTSKPVMIGETGSGEVGDDTTGSQKAAWIYSALVLEIPTEFPRVRAFVWFNESKKGIESDGEDWHLGTALERHAFAEAANHAPYTGRPPRT